MPRHVVAGLAALILAGAGCLPRRSAPAVPFGSVAAPVGIQPLPSLHEAINNVPLVEPAPKAVRGPVGSLPLPASRHEPAVSLVEPPPPESRPMHVPEPPPVDEAVRPAAVGPDPTALRSQVEPGRLLGLTVATVGTETIGLGELTDAVNEWIRVYVPKGQRLAPSDRAELSRNLLESLIDRAVLVQEARRSLLKGDKQRAAFERFVNDQWKEREVPRLLRRFQAASERELRFKLEEQGRSLELMRERYQREVLAREFLAQRVQSRLVPPEGPQLMAYYQEHLQEFHRPAQTTWREIAVKVGPRQDRAAARRKIEALHARLRRGEDFAAVAKSDSEGATAAQGGLWQTEPGAAAVPAVNQAIESLPLNQISPIVEGPSSYHILRVEDRRAAGPAPFYEVQNQIRATLQEAAFQKEVEIYMKELRGRTVITYHLKDPARPVPQDNQARPAALP